MEEGDAESLALWAQLRQRSVEELTHMYARLGVSFDVIEGESQDGMKSRQFMEDLICKGILKPAIKSGMEGSLVIDIGSRSVPLFKRDSSSLYLTRDIMAAQRRFAERKYDRMLYVVEMGQRVHFENLIQALDLLNPEWKALKKPVVEHLPFGRVSGMSTRKGNVILLEELLDEAVKRVRASLDATTTTKVDNRDETSEKLAVGAIIVADLEKRRRTDYTFNWNKALNFKIESGITLQYAHARLCSLERNLEGGGGRLMEGKEAAKWLVDDEPAVRLIQALASFDEVLKAAKLQHEPSIIVRYLHDISHLSNKAFKVLPVKSVAGTDLGQARLCLFRCVRIVLATGMRLLGVDALERM